MRILDPNETPINRDRLGYTYGETEIKTLAEFYGKLKEMKVVIPCVKLY